MTPVRGVSPGIVSDTSLNHLLSPKFISARARPLGKTENRAGRLILFFIVGGVFWTFVFGMLYRLLRYFRGIPEIGALLAGKLLAVMFVSLFGILILSNVVTALSMSRVDSIFHTASIALGTSFMPARLRRSGIH